MGATSQRTGSHLSSSGGISSGDPSLLPSGRNAAVPCICVTCVFLGIATCLTRTHLSTRINVIRMSLLALQCRMHCLQVLHAEAWLANLLQARCERQEDAVEP